MSFIGSASSSIDTVSLSVGSASSLTDSISSTVFNSSEDLSTPESHQIQFSYIPDTGTSKTGSDLFLDRLFSTGGRVNSMATQTEYRVKLQCLDLYSEQFAWSQLGALLKSTFYINTDRYRYLTSLAKNNFVDALDEVEKARDALKCISAADYDLFFFWMYLRVMRGTPDASLQVPDNEDHFLNGLMDNFLRLIISTEKWEGYVDPQSLKVLVDEAPFFIKSPHSIQFILLHLFAHSSFEKGLNLCDEAIEANPSNPAFPLQRVMFLLCLQRKAEAQQVLDEYTRDFKPYVVELLKKACLEPNINFDDLHSSLKVLNGCLSLILPYTMTINSCPQFVNVDKDQKTWVVECTQFAISECLVFNPLDEQLNLAAASLKNFFADTTVHLKLSSLSYFARAGKSIYNHETCLRAYILELSVYDPDKALTILKQAPYDLLFSVKMRMVQFKLEITTQNFAAAKQSFSYVYESYRTDKSTPATLWVTLLCTISSLHVYLGEYAEASKFQALALPKLKRVTGDDPLRSYYEQRLNGVEACCAINQNDFAKAELLIEKNIELNPESVVTYQIKFALLCKKGMFDEAVELYAEQNHFLNSSKDLFSSENLFDMFIDALYKKERWKDLAIHLRRIEDLSSSTDFVKETLLKTVMRETLYFLERKYYAAEAPTLHEQSIVILRSLIFSESHLFMGFRHNYDCLVALHDFEDNKKQTALRTLSRLAKSNAMYMPYHASCEKLKSLTHRPQEKVVLYAEIEKKVSSAIDIQEASTPIATTIIAPRIKETTSSTNSHWAPKAKKEKSVKKVELKNSEPLPDIVRYRFRQELIEMQEREKSLTPTLAPSAAAASTSRKVEIVGKAHAYKLIMEPFSEVELFLINSVKKTIPDLLAATVCDAHPQRKMNEIYYNLFKIFETLKKISVVSENFNNVRNELRHNFRITLDDLVQLSTFLTKENHLANYLDALIKNGKKNPAKMTLLQFSAKSPLDQRGYLDLLRLELTNFDAWIAKLGYDEDILAKDPGLHKMIKGVYQRVGQILRALKDQCGMKFSPEINFIIMKSNFEAHTDAGDIDTISPVEGLKFLMSAKNKLHQFWPQPTASVAQAAAAAASAAPTRRPKKRVTKK